MVPPQALRLTIKQFLALACTYILLQSMVVTGLVSAALTSIERQFSFSSSQTSSYASESAAFHRSKSAWRRATSSATGSR